jgi:hypothetical protein
MVCDQGRVLGMLEGVATIESRTARQRVGATMASSGGRSPKPRPLGGDWSLALSELVEAEESG